MTIASELHAFAAWLTKEDWDGDTNFGYYAYENVMVSTVASVAHPPIENTLAPRAQLFETAVFGGKFHGNTYRWHTAEEAIAGHEKVVAMVEATIALEKHQRDTKPKT